MHVPRARPAIVATPAAATVFLAPVAQAQTVPTGFQEYFVLGYEQHVWDMMTKVVNGPPGPGEGGGPLTSPPIRKFGDAFSCRSLERVGLQLVE